MPLILRRVGRYELLREVGRGGMAVVYLARQTDLDRYVALKELGAHYVSNPAFAERFVRESRLTGGLSHPNIVTVHDFLEHAGVPYIAMEYLERGSLRPFVGRLTLAQVAGVLEGLLAGLAHAESKGIVHRDLKPENLMVTNEGAIKIADFGIAKAFNQVITSSRYLTATGTAIGTPTYMAPEQAMAKEIGPWTDLYSAGVIAYELIVGTVPFHVDENPVAVLLKHVNEPPPPPRSIEPALDRELSDWIEWLLEKEPSARPASALDAWYRLEEIVMHLIGPRWRREARVIERAPEADAPKPLTPAPFFDDTAAAERREPSQSDTGVPASPTDDNWVTYGRPAEPDRAPAAEATPEATPAPPQAVPEATAPPVEPFVPLAADAVTQPPQALVAIEEPRAPEVDEPTGEASAPDTVHTAAPEPVESGPAEEDEAHEEPPAELSVPEPAFVTYVPPGAASAPPAEADPAPPVEDEVAPTREPEEEDAPPASDTTPEEQGGDEPVLATLEPEFVTYMPVDAPQPPPAPVQPEPVALEPETVAAEAPAAVITPPPLEVPAAEPEVAPEPPAQPEDPAPPALTMPAGVQDRSFEWPAVAPGAARLGRSRRFIVVATVAGLAAIGVGVVLLTGGGSKKQPPGRPSAGPEPRPAALDRVALGTSGSSLILAAPRGHVLQLTEASLKPTARRTDPAAPRAVVPAGSTMIVADDEALTALRADLSPAGAAAFPGALALASDGGTEIAAVRAGQLCLFKQLAREACARLGFVPAGVAMSPSGTVFVVDRAHDAVVPFRSDGAKLNAQAAVHVGANPSGGMATHGGSLYIPIDRGVAVVDTTTGKLSRTIALPGTPSALAVDAAGRHLFAALYAHDSIAIVDLAGGAAPKLVHVAPRPVAIAVGRDSADVFAYSVDGATLTRLDATGRVLRRLKLPALVTRPTRLLAGPPALRAHGRNVVVTLPLLGGALDTRSLVVSDGSITDGTASLELWQGGIGSHAGSARTAAGLTAKVARLPGRLLLKLTSAAGAFTTMHAALGAGGKSLVVTLAKPAPTPSTGHVTPSQPPSHPPVQPPPTQTTTPGITAG